VPLYEYECDEHGHRFEVIQKFSDPPIEVCPTCGGHVHKLISSPAFQFKGSGWYITDYARKDSGGGKPSESGEKGEKSEKGEKTESKDAAKTSDKDSASKKTESTSGPDTKSST
jgi:putative FmdB family regulatory protein